MNKLRKWLIHKLGGTEKIAPYPNYTVVQTDTEMFAADCIVPAAFPEDKVKASMARTIADGLLKNNFIKWEMTDALPEYCEPQKRYVARIRVVK